MKHFASLILALVCAVSTHPDDLPAQSKPLKEVRVPYALGGSTSFFWVAQRSGSFEKHGLKVLPIFMRGGREAVQALAHDARMLKLKTPAAVGAPLITPVCELSSKPAGSAPALT